MYAIWLTLCILGQVVVEVALKCILSFDNDETINSRDTAAYLHERRHNTVTFTKANQHVTEDSREFRPSHF